MKLLYRIILVLIIGGSIALLSIYLINNRIQSQFADKIKDSITEIPVESPPRIAIVLGAKVWENGEPSNVLYDRVVTAAELYRAGRVRKILMSGDNPTENYDEPTAMKLTAVKLGVPAGDVILDFAGRRTYDTCFRAKEIFEIQKAIIVTQEFHQARTLYLCNNLGIDSIGVTANRRKYEGAKYWAFREFFSRASAWFEINLLPFEPIRGNKEPIVQ
ncbi:MAG: YdcF family protein [Pyrinomonadaceae bacterium]|nr:YdcF family protein [Pyrinomonadaceae bacterium]